MCTESAVGENLKNESNSNSNSKPTPTPTPTPTPISNPDPNPTIKSQLKKHDAWRTGPRQNTDMTLKEEEIPNIRESASVLGDEWCGIFEKHVDFKLPHFLAAMRNLIDSPNINSTVILRADILRKTEYSYKAEKETPETDEFVSNQLNEDPLLAEPCETVLTRNISDTKFRKVPLNENFKPTLEIVRRMIPRNPSKDYIINQTCQIWEYENKDKNGNESESESQSQSQSELEIKDQCDRMTLVLYTPHIDNPDDTPFYLPPARSIGILFNPQKATLSLSYLPFESQPSGLFREMAPSERPIRIAYRLLNTAKKHSNGVMTGYTKRVNHDQVVPKQVFQDRYIYLKQKYAKQLVENWRESTDPRKHVFEDVAIAAFLIELWNLIYPSKEVFEFRDLGCGNGILVYILKMEGYIGEGIDARQRKSWEAYPEDVQQCLKEQVLIPSVLLRPHPQSLNSVKSHNGQIWKVPIANKMEMKEFEKQTENLHNTDSGNVRNVQLVECYTSKQLLNEPFVNPAEFPPNTFIIGNHSDELTCWIPLLGYPFMVIPCCSHRLNGEKTRFPVMKGLNGKPFQEGASTYQGLVDHVHYLASLYGWNVEREMLRIPSTRNAAVIGYQNNPYQRKSIYEILAMEGGAQEWVENSIALMKQKPRNH